jgi:hypothetical protein
VRVDAKRLAPVLLEQSIEVCAAALDHLFSLLQLTSRVG